MMDYLAYPVKWANPYEALKVILVYRDGPVWMVYLVLKGTEVGDYSNVCVCVCV